MPESNTKKLSKEEFHRQDSIRKGIILSMLHRELWDRLLGKEPEHYEQERHKGPWHVAAVWVVMRLKKERSDAIATLKQVRKLIDKPDTPASRETITIIITEFLDSVSPRPPSEEP